jgi:hypothetical protein
MNDPVVRDALHLLDLHYTLFHEVEPHASATCHPFSMDTRGWSQIMVSTLTGVKGLGGKKGADLIDGSDVKSASTWGAINTPRFNSVIKAGTKSSVSGTMKSLDKVPHIYLVLWDTTTRDTDRCRIWVVRPQHDRKFRSVCAAWYKLFAAKKTSDNFQLHPPRGKDSNLITNKCGNLQYPLYLAAERSRTSDSHYDVVTYDPIARSAGLCTP